MPPKYQLESPVEMLAKKLTSVHIPKEAIRKAAENARILETRVRTGNLGKIDRPNTRAAVLLEIAYRQETKSHLPWQILASAVNVKVLQLEQLQQSLNNYLQAPSIRGTLHDPIETLQRPAAAARMEQRLSTQVQAIQKQIAGHKRPLNLEHFRQTIEDDSRRRSSRSKTAEPDPRRLENLAIRVQILDHHKVCKLAKQFFDDMTNWVSHDPSLSESDRRGQLYDFIRYGPAYEAAALYCIADGELQLDDLVNASTEFTRLELKQVLPFVKEMFKKLKSHEVTNRKNASSNKDIDSSHIDAMEVDYLVNTQQAIQAEKTARENEEAARFLEWRQIQLEHAMNQARISMSDRDEQVTESSDAEVLAFAADDILRKYGILQ